MHKSHRNALERPAAMFGLSVVFAIIGTPYLLHALGIETSWLSDELLGKCSGRGRMRACNSSPYAISSMLGFGIFFCAVALALAVSAIGKRFEVIGGFIVVTGHIGLGYAATSHLLRRLNPNERGDGFSALMAGFVRVYCIVYLTLHCYGLKKSWAAPQQPTIKR
jgi:hypothetical protein